MANLPSRFAPSESHTARKIAESFGTNAQRYNRTRPRYPEAMVEAILGATSGADVLDVGMGTGVSAEAFDRAGCRVLGVEPDERMAQCAKERGFEVEVSKFEDWDPLGRTFDAVIAGQSWHWVDPVAGAAKAALALRPGGALAVFWNVFLPPPDLAAAFAEAYRREVPDVPFTGGTMLGLAAYSQFFTKAADGIRRAGSFDQPEERRFDWRRSYSKDEWLDLVPTFGGHNLFRPDQLEKLLQGIGSEIDAVGGRFVMEFATVVVLAASSRP